MGALHFILSHLAWWERTHLKDPLHDQTSWKFYVAVLICAWMVHLLPAWDDLAELAMARESACAPCAVKACVVRPVFARVIRELRGSWWPPQPVECYTISASPPRDRDRDSQPRPRPRLNSQPQGATKCGQQIQANVQGPVKQIQVNVQRLVTQNASPGEQPEVPRRRWKPGQEQHQGPQNQDSQHMLNQPKGSHPERSLQLEPSASTCQRIAKGAGGKGHVKKTQKSSKIILTLFDNFSAGYKKSKIVKKCQK